MYIQMATYINKHFRFGALWLFLIHYQQSHADPLVFLNPDLLVHTTSIATTMRMNDVIFRYGRDKNQFHKKVSTKVVNLSLSSFGRTDTVANNVPINKKAPRTLGIGNGHKHKIQDKKITDFTHKNALRIPDIGVKQMDKTQGNDDTYPEYGAINATNVAGNSIGLNPYQMDEQIKKIFKGHRSVIMESIVIGRTASYNDILLYKIENRKTFLKRSKAQDVTASDGPDKKIIFIVHGLSSMGLGKLCSLTDEKYLEKLISFYLAHLNNFDILLMPMANPDGYLQSKLHTYWNKNVSPQGLCTGVALDRNFDVAWNISNLINACSQRYPGPVPFSEAESRAVRDVFTRYSHRLIAYFHVHSGTFDADIFKGDAVLYPNGYKDAHSAEDKYMELKIEIDEAIRNANFRVLTVTVDSLYNWYGKVTGSSVDYAETIYTIPYAMELVMQIYTDPLTLNKLKAREIDKELGYYALNEIWSRVINTTFTYIWQKMNTEEDEK